MGTRGFVGFNTADGLRGSYNHFDSYPSALGKTVQKDVRWISDTMTWAELREAIAAIRWVEATHKPSEEDLKAFAGTRDTRVSTGDDWYSLLREAQGRLHFMLKNRIATDDSRFPKDSLFCEWGYVLDLTTEELVVLRGFNNEEAKQSPMCRTDDPYKASSSTYWGCSEAWRGSMADFLDLDMDKLEEEIDAKEEAEQATS